jgi:hypothetical protein
MSQLQQLVETLEAQEQIKKDFLAPSADMHFVDGNLYMLHAGQQVIFSPTTVFHGQVAEKLGIPKGYYDRMKEKALHLLDDNVNHWLHDEGKNLLIRTFVREDGDNDARAFLSDRYNIIDNFDVLLQALESIKESGLEVNVSGAELSQTRMYLHITCPQIEVEATEMLKYYRRTIEVGSGIISGFVLQNSEIGFGSFQVAPRAVVLACNNGMVNTRDAMRRVHLGGKLDELDFYKNDAVKNANRKLVKEQVKHAVQKFLSKDYLKNLVNTFTELGAKEIEAPIANVMEVVAKNYGFSQEEKASLLDHFIRGGDTRRIGVINAVTELAQTFDDADHRNDTEAISYELLTSFNKIEAAAVKADIKAN